MATTSTCDNNSNNNNPTRHDDDDDDDDDTSNRNMLSARPVVLRTNEDHLVITPVPDLWSSDGADLLMPPPLLPQRRSLHAISTTSLSMSFLEEISIPDLSSSPIPKKIVKTDHEGSKTWLRPRFQQQGGTASAFSNLLLMGASTSSRRRRIRISKEIAIKLLEEEKKQQTQQPQQHGASPRPPSPEQNQHEAGVRMPFAATRHKKKIPPHLHVTATKTTQSSPVVSSPDFKYPDMEKGEDVAFKHDDHEETATCNIQCCQRNVTTGNDDEKNIISKLKAPMMDDGIAELPSQSLDAAAEEVLPSPSTSIARSA